MLACAVRAEGRREMMGDGIAAARDNGLDWDHLLSLSLTQGMYPTLYRALSALQTGGSDHDVPARVLTRLQSWYDVNARQSLRLTGELLDVLEVLEDAGIPAVPLKGLTLAEWIYGDVAARKAGDLDVLIPKGAVPTAVERLREMGLRPPRGTPSLDRFLNAVDHYSYKVQRNVNTASTTIVELHWAMTTRLHGFAIANERLATRQILSRLENISFQGRSIRVPCADDYLLYLCAHTARHGWIHLYQLQDLHQLIRSSARLEWIFAERPQTDVWNVDVVHPTLYLLQRLFDTPLPGWVQAGVEDMMERRPVVQKLFDVVGRSFSQVESPSLLRYWILFPVLLEQRSDRLKLIRYQFGRMMKPDHADRTTHKMPDRLVFLYPVIKIATVGRQMFAFVVRSFRVWLRKLW